MVDSPDKSSDLESLYRDFTEVITNAVEKFEKAAKLCVEKIDLRREEIPQPDGITVQTNISMVAKPDDSPTKTAATAKAIRCCCVSD